MAARTTLEKPATWQAFAFELLVYAALVTAYFFLAFHYMGAWFKDLFDHDRKLYATMALVLMIGQTVVLEIVCGALVWLVRGRQGKGK